jgi:hypothetical protein
VPGTCFFHLFFIQPETPKAPPSSLSSYSLWSPAHPRAAHAVFT